MKSKSNDELAALLEANQVDRLVLSEAASRLRRIGLDELLASVETVQAINESPLIDKKTAELGEPLVLGPTLRKQSSARLSSLAGRIMNGADYTHDQVLSLAASVMSQDETSQSS